MAIKNGSLPQHPEELAAMLNVAHQFAEKTATNFHNLLQERCLAR